MIEKKIDTFYSRMSIKPLKDGNKIGKSSRNRHKEFLMKRSVTKAAAFERISKQRFGW